ncbi:MAG: hypothetical protein EA369_07575 [Bradymonadales bacterium]|nr:MAG: hypothetical protein EA369_07575 [Bradymonadales bacterium]
MNVVKVTKDYRIFKKRSGRYAVQSLQKAWIHSDDKIQILQREGLIKLTPAKKEPEIPPAAEGQAATASVEAGASDGATEKSE